MQPRCWIHRGGLSEILSECSRWSLRETGGALLGWLEGDRYVVARILGPGPNARHGFTFFEPDASWQVERGRQIYAESGRTIAYLGDWHSHPMGKPTPSQRDRVTAAEIAAEPSFRTPHPLYAIAGRARRGVFLRGPWALYVYLWNGDALEPVELLILERRGRSAS